MQGLIESAKLKHYREGMTDGVILALEAVLGISAKGATGSAWEGEVPSDLRVWLETALERAEAERRALR